MTWPFYTKRERAQWNISSGLTNGRTRLDEANSCRAPTSRMAMHLSRNVWARVHEALHHEYTFRGACENIGMWVNTCVFVECINAYHISGGKCVYLFHASTWRLYVGQCVERRSIQHTWIHFHKPNRSLRGRMLAGTRAFNVMSYACWHTCFQCNVVCLLAHVLSM
jgi:hypothetical protein